MNFPPHIFAGRRYAVVGLGRNGLPAAHALLAAGAAVAVWDDSEPARAQAAAEGLTVAEPAMTGLDALVLSPGIPHLLPRAHPVAAAAIAAGVPILSDAELLFQAVRASGSRARFAGITGTNGKSTTTALLAHILTTANIRNEAGGNLGTASLALGLLPHDAVYVLEMSSYMLERLATLRFDAAVMLNLSPDHLDRHGDMQGYARAKRAIFDRQGMDDVAVIGVDDAWSREMAASVAPARVVTVSASGPADYCTRGSVLVRGGDAIVDLGCARALPGAHNAQNAAAAAALADALGVPWAQVAEGILSYPGLAHRQEDVGSVAGIRFVNDSKATNADSTARALACYDRVVWIAGGQAKAGGISDLAPFLSRIARAFLIGRDAPILAETLAQHGVPFSEVWTLEEATRAAFAAARAGEAEVVLLSPACASWDQFKSFEHRGDTFRDLVARLREGV
jgi:UDP-N-acetylmuramoylalanine--D-glutamate ligase